MSVPLPRPDDADAEIQVPDHVAQPVFLDDVEIPEDEVDPRVLEVVDGGEV